MEDIGQSSEWDDPTEYWRMAQYLGDTIHIKDQHYKDHFHNIQNEFMMKVSNSCCKIEDIRGIIYGGMSSRFWLYRKHIIYLDSQYDNAIIDDNDDSHQVNVNYKPPKQQTKVPFFSWECITLELPGRNIDLVIKDENDMMKFIKYLIWKLDMINNKKQSGAKVMEELRK